MRLKAGLSTDPAICVLNAGEIWSGPISLHCPCRLTADLCLRALHHSPCRDRGLISKQSIALCSFSLWFSLYLVILGGEGMEVSLLICFSLSKRVRGKFWFELLSTMKKKHFLSFRRAQCGQIPIYWKLGHHFFVQQWKIIIVHYKIEKLFVLNMISKGLNEMCIQINRKNINTNSIRRQRICTVLH